MSNLLGGAWFGRLAMLVVALPLCAGHSLAAEEFIIRPDGWKYQPLRTVHKFECVVEQCGAGSTVLWANVKFPKDWSLAYYQRTTPKIAKDSLFGVQSRRSLVALDEIDLGDSRIIKSIFKVEQDDTPVEYSVSYALKLSNRDIVLTGQSPSLEVAENNVALFFSLISNASTRALQ